MFNTAERASLGAKLLDAMRPGWAQKIDLSALDMTNFDHCILGQLYKGYLRGCSELLIPLYHDQIKFGFMPLCGEMGSSEAYQIETKGLLDAFTQEIKNRLK